MTVCIYRYIHTTGLPNSFPVNVTKIIFSAANQHWVLHTNTKGHVVTYRTPNDTSDGAPNNQQKNKIHFFYSLFRTMKITTSFFPYELLVFEQQPNTEDHGIRIYH